jgi:deoxyinosine 3'endonuclease (endonuclease V)
MRATLCAKLFGLQVNFLFSRNREIPAFLELFQVFNKQNTANISIDVILMDGNGILHPHGCGIASHFGVLVDIPTIGCGKTIFQVDGINKDMVLKIRDEWKLNDAKKGASSKLVGDSGRVWAAGLKSGKDSSDPLIVSVGHRISLDTALKIVDLCSSSRVPEPIRVADKTSRIIIKDFDKKIKDKALGHG